MWDFPGGSVVKSLPCHAGDVRLISGRGTKIPHSEGNLVLELQWKIPHDAMKNLCAATEA